MVGAVGDSIWGLGVSSTWLTLGVEHQSAVKPVAPAREYISVCINVAVLVFGPSRASDTNLHKTKDAIRAKRDPKPGSSEISGDEYRVRL